MKRVSMISVMLFLAAFLAMPVNVSAQALDEVSVQGYLTDSGGLPVDNPSLKMRFSMHDAVSAGTELWFEEQFVSVNQGVYSVRLGSATPIPSSLDFNSVYYLETGIDDGAGGFEILSNRQPISAVPYAMNAMRLDGLTSTDFAPASHNHNTLYVGVGQADSVTGPMILDSSVLSADVGFNYAASSTKGGPAIDLNCASCVSMTELDFTPGTITQVIAGSGLNGGGSLGSVTLNLDVPLSLSGTSSAQILDVSNFGSGPAAKFTGSVDSTMNIKAGGSVEAKTEYRLDGQRLISSNVTGGNLSIGSNTGSGGTLNTFIGVSAGQGSSGFANTLIGYQTGHVSTGDSNVFIGSTAGLLSSSGNNNTIIGTSAGASSSGGSENVLIGMETAVSSTTGINNTMVGTQAGWSNIGSNNVFLGYHAGYNETGSDKLYIANSETNTLIYGDFSTGRVGINTTTPGGTLDVNGEIWQRGGQLHADYVFEPDYKLESIDDHAKFMWDNRHLKAIPKATVDAQGREVIMVGSHRRGIVEELEKAHIYIEQLNARLKVQQEEIESLKKAVEAMNKNDD